VYCTYIQSSSSSIYSPSYKHIQNIFICSVSKLVSADHHDSRLPRTCFLPLETYMKRTLCFYNRFVWFESACMCTLYLVCGSYACIYVNKMLGRLASTVAKVSITLKFPSLKYQESQTLVSVDVGCSRQINIMVATSCFTVCFKDAIATALQCCVHEKHVGHSLIFTAQCTYCMHSAVLLSSVVRPSVRPSVCPSLCV